jgi:hypothetical protein
MAYTGLTVGLGQHEGGLNAAQKQSFMFVSATGTYAKNYADVPKVDLASSSK